MEELVRAKNEVEAIEIVIDIIKSNLNVGKGEVAVLLFESKSDTLKFVYPKELRDSGAIPLNASDSMATKVFKTKVGFISNNFQNLKHLSFFEKLSKDSEPIKKLIAAPIIKGESALGVIEVSKRKIGENFSKEDLAYLEQIGELLGEKLWRMKNEDKD